MSTNNDFDDITPQSLLDAGAAEFPDADDDNNAFAAAPPEGGEAEAADEEMADAEPDALVAH